MKKTLLLDAISGISGDMSVAALLDLGAPREPLDAFVKSLPADGFHVHVSRVKKAALDCCDFDVHLDAAHENHDHDMDYLHGHEHHHEHHHEHDHEHHEHPHEHHHPHEHRGWREIEAIFAASVMTDGARALALKVFRILAEAEAKAHGVPVEEVHFHEVGAIDSIVDIGAFAVLFDALGVEAVCVPRLCEGRGTVRCQHGVLPIPVPAVTRISEAHGLRLEFLPVEGELVTPTGAAIVAAIRTTEELPKRARIVASGLGAGKRDYACAGFLRAMLLEEEEAPEAGQVCKMECNVDDSTGEELGFAMERLMAEGALEANFSPVFMKKSRPGWLVTVLCRPADRERMGQLLFTHTSTLGVRWTEMDRVMLPREMVRVQTPWGDVPVKKVTVRGAVRVHAEYEVVAEIARREGLPFRAVAEAAEAACR